ncbi:unnamed protein product [Haemonchus placei]|uniref:Pyridoxamine 5'-phosphate oxidase family protein n=1 Tax=Haemonchus placei TaxID=6290 RepID=A0A0N4VSU4_HAEPC|nr:unnamed protein product [Haemonchus placei]
MAFITFKARALTSEACIEDLMMQAGKIKCDAIGLTKATPVARLFENGELFLATCDNRGADVLEKNTYSLGHEHGSYGSLTRRIGRLRSICGSTTALTIFAAYAPTSSYEEELEADLERLYREDHTFFKVVDPNAKIGYRRTAEGAPLRNSRNGIE